MSGIEGRDGVYSRGWDGLIRVRGLRRPFHTGRFALVVATTAPQANRVEDGGCSWTHGLATDYVMCAGSPSEKGSRARSNAPSSPRSGPRAVENLEWIR
jgi:hypothetical protein